MMRPLLIFIVLIGLSFVANGQITILGKNDTTARRKFAQLMAHPIQRTPWAETPIHYTSTYHQPKFTFRLPEYFMEYNFGSTGGIKSPRLYSQSPNRYEFMNRLHEEQRK